jgi:ABC-type polysaccharide/polyol phosphate export permease
MHAHLMHAPAREVPLGKIIRSVHRWTSIAFALIVTVIFVMLGIGVQPPQWLLYLPLAPLFVLMLTGLYMFFLPYVAKARRAS